MSRNDRTRSNSAAHGRRDGTSVAIAAGAALVLALAPGPARAEDKGQMPDTTGMGAMMRQMGAMTEQMQASMPDAQFKNLAIKIGDEWKAVELSRAQMKTGTGVGTMAKAMIGLGGPKSWLVMEGEKSDLVLADAKPRFRFKGAKKDATSFRLGAFEVADGGRHAQVDAGKQAEIFKHSIPLELTKVGDDLWEISPKKPLDPGQYGIANSMAGSVADFAIGGGK